MRLLLADADGVPFYAVASWMGFGKKQFMPPKVRTFRQAGHLWGGHIMLSKMID